MLRGNDHNHCEVGLVFHDGGRKVFFRSVLNGKITEPVVYADAPGKDVTLSVEASPLQYEFFCSTPHGKRMSLGTARTRDLSSEAVGGFTGVYMGLYASGNGQTNSVPADFDWFEYRSVSK